MKRFKYVAEIKIKRQDINHIKKAIESELNIKERAYAEFKVKNDEGFLVVKANDANSFRAALNSYLRILQTTENIQKEVKL